MSTLTATTTTRVLVAARLSRLVKGRDQVSIERQDRQAEEYAAREPGRVIVATAADAGVSGSVSPFKRPLLGPYLTDPDRIGSWDEIVAATLDRLGRNARDLAALRDFAEDYGKRITILSPALTWPPPPGDLAAGLIWDVLGRLAEIELNLTKGRYAATREFLRDSGSMIGKPVWGFEIVGTKADKTLAPATARLPYLMGMITRAEAGESLEAIAAWLDAEAADHAGARPRHGGRWSPKSIGSILRNPSLYGHRYDNGRLLLKHAGVIPKTRWDALVAKLDANPKRRGPTRNAPALLTDVLRCGTCGGIMHARRINGRPHKDGTPGPVWVGYRCDGKARQPSRCRNMVRADEIEPWVNEQMVSLNGDLEVVEQRLIPARGHAEEVAEIEAELRALDLDADDVAERFAALRAERARLLALGTEPAHYEAVHTGESVAARWTRLTTAQRRDYLRRADVTILHDPESTSMVVESPNRLRVA